MNKGEAYRKEQTETPHDRLARVVRRKSPMTVAYKTTTKSGMSCLCGKHSMTWEIKDGDKTFAPHLAGHCDDIAQGNTESWVRRWRFGSKYLITRMGMDMLGSRSANLVLQVDLQSS